MQLRGFVWTSGAAVILTTGIWLAHDHKSAFAEDTPAPDVPFIGQKASDFQIQDLSGHAVSLASFRGKKVVFLDFWATWCGPCKASLPELQKMRDKYAKSNFEILSIDEQEEPEKVSQFAATNHYTLHMLLDSDGSVATQYDVQAVPTQVLIDEDGVIRWRHMGYSPNDPAFATLDKLLAELVQLTP